MVGRPEKLSTKSYSVSENRNERESTVRRPSKPPPKMQAVSSDKNKRKTKKIESFRERATSD
jgi:hypothetical protein